MHGNIVLVNTNQMKPGVAPLALDYLAPPLEERGYTVDILDLCFADNAEKEVASYFASNAVIAVGVTIRNSDDCYFASQEFFLPFVKRVVKTIQEHTSAPIILGGVAFSTMPEAILRFCGLDFGIWGEGEENLPSLLDCLQGRDDYSQVPGLVYRNGSGYTRNAPDFLRLDEVPARPRRSIDNIRYLREGGMAGIETKRGCEAACIYCADPVSKGRKHRLRSPDKVVAEIEALLAQGVDYWHTCDAEFNLPAAHAAAICQEIIARGLGERMRWYAYASPGPFDAKLAGLMKEAGCVGIDFGVDSGSDKMLRALGRDFTVEDLRRTARICHDHGFAFMFDLLLGGPGETGETMRETVELMKALEVPCVGVSLGVRIYAGTRLAAQVIKAGLNKGNRALRGRIENNPGFLEPLYYLSPELGDDAESQLRRLIGEDKRFFFGSRDERSDNYNYNDNAVLVEAIQRGYRGAFWDILRRLALE